MLNITVIGKMGEGKTTFVKTFIKNKRRVVFDVNNEYGDLPENTDLKASRVTDLNHKAFVNLCLTKKNTCCVFEDSTGFIEGKLSEGFRKMLISKRHTGNVNILLFHSIASVPPRLMQLSDFIVLFKTSDEDYAVLKKYPSIYDSYLKVRAMPKYGFSIVRL